MLSRNKRAVIMSSSEIGLEIEVGANLQEEASLPGAKPILDSTQEDLQEDLREDLLHSGVRVEIGLVLPTGTVTTTTTTTTTTTRIRNRISG